MTDYLFVYGTLRPATGHPRTRFLADDDPVGPGRICGRLYDTGPYPVVVLSNDAADFVRGDLFLIRSPKVRFEELDEEEGCPPETAPADGLFRREQTTVRMEDGRTLSAWVYLWNGSIDDLMFVPSGDYLFHLSGRIDRGGPGAATP